MAKKTTLGLSLVVLGFILLALTGIRTISTPGIFTHVALGQAGNAATDPLSYTMANQTWINLTPMYNSFVFALWSLGGADGNVGAGLITLFHVLIVLAAFVLMYRFAKEWGGPVSQALALLLCARLMLPLFTPGPYVFFMLFTALFITLLYRLRNFAALAVSIIVLQIFWTNLHPSFLFGPLLILLFAIENWQDTRKTSRSASLMTPLTVRLLGLAGVAALVTLINPNVINLHVHIFSNWSVLTGNDNLEWISLFSRYFSPVGTTRLTLFALVLGAGGLITQKKRLPLLLTIVALIGAFMTVLSIGSLHLFAFLAFPFIVLSFNAIGEFFVRTVVSTAKPKAALLAGVLAGVAAILIIFSAGSLLTNRAYANMGSAAGFGLGVQEDAFPVAAAGILERNDFPKNIINLAHDGGYLSLQNPDRKIFTDTRFSFYGNEFYLNLNRALLGQPEAWRSILTKWNPHAVVLNACWPDTAELVNRLIASKTWKLVYFDGATVILVRDLPEYATLINDQSIQTYGTKILNNQLQKYAAKNKGLFKEPNPSRLIGAGGIYLILNRPQQAEAVYRAITAGNPNLAGGWLGLGQSMILQKQLTRGIEYMERAAKITPQNAQIWLSLMRAYGLKGEQSKVQMAADRLNKLIKADKSTIEQQEAAAKQTK